MKNLRKPKRKILELEQLFISNDLANVSSQVARFVKTNQIEDYRVNIYSKRLKIRMDNNSHQVKAKLIYRKPVEKIFQ